MRDGTGGEGSQAEKLRLNQELCLHNSKAARLATDLVLREGGGQSETARGPPLTNQDVLKGIGLRFRSRQVMELNPDLLCSFFFSICISN